MKVESGNRTDIFRARFTDGDDDSRRESDVEHGDLDVRLDRSTTDSMTRWPSYIDYYNVLSTCFISRAAGGDSELLLMCAAAWFVAFVRFTFTPLTLSPASCLFITTLLRRSSSQSS